MSPSADSSVWTDRQVALVDLLDRLLAGGVVLTGDIVLSIADVDLVQISLRALIRSVPGEGGELWTDQTLDQISGGSNRRTSGTSGPDEVLPPGSTPTGTPSNAT